MILPRSIDTGVDAHVPVLRRAGDVLLLLGMAIGVFGALCGVHMSIAMDNRAKQKEPVALLIVTGVQAVTVVQILGVFDVLTIEWPKPFNSMLNFASLFKLKMLTLNVGCVSAMTDLTEYILTALGVGGLVLAMVGIHVAFSCAFPQ